MKKYAIIIGENNEDLSKRVQEALFAVGFEWCGPPRQGVMHTDAMLLFVNCSGNGEFHYRETEGELKSIGEIDDAVLTAPSWVIENAHKLDGAKQPWLIPPKGYRLVTESERKEFKSPNIKMRFFYEPSDKWLVCSADPDVDWLCHIKLAVPLDYVFTKPEPKKMTVAQVSALVGEDVVIVEG